MDPPRPDSLDLTATHEWLQLADQTMRARFGTSASSIVNVTLESAADREPQSPASPAYRLWIADNLARDGRYADAIAAYDECVDAAALPATRLIQTLDPIASALRHKAQAAALLGNSSAAMAIYQELGTHDPANASDAFLHAGLIAEGNEQLDKAADFYRAIAGKTPSRRTDNAAELARRALLRLEQTQTEYASDPYRLVESLSTALERRDASAIRRLASRTHFAVGPVGGHTAFEDPELLEHLCSELGRSRVTVRRRLVGSGGKQYLETRGWKGKWFLGDVMFIITKAPQGWQWTGLAITSPNDRWLEHWRPAVKQTNQPLPFDLFAPWPADQCFTAGGLNQYIGEQLAVIGGGIFFGAALALFYSRGCCGWGPRGYYYNQAPTHDEQEAFAIDFTRYRQYVPYDNESGGTPVLAVRAGIVNTVQAGTPTGDSSASNTVHIEHADPADPSNLSRFTSRYLHMEGPFKILVSSMMPIFLGNRIGLMDDTGNSILDHLHFSIHDRNIPYPGGFAYGASVRPTLMSGVQLEDGDGNTCVRSTNVEYRGEKPMKEITAFAGQNWVITPAATATGQAPPGRIQDQKFLVVLSGVAMVDLKGNSGATWLRETLSIQPDLRGPIQYAINRYGLPSPPGNIGANFLGFIQVEQWAPFAALSSMFNRNESINSGFAVDVWRPNPFGAGTDFSNAPINNLFNGIQVDVAVRDTDAWIHRVSYHITLIGKIVFAPIIIL